MASNVSLTNLGSLAGAAINSSDDNLSAALGTLGPDATAGQLVAFQTELTKNSLASATWSAIVKERGDTLKGVVQKFG